MKDEEVGVGSYLVRVIPQRGFTSRRRSGLVFDVRGRVIGEEQVTEAIRSDPGLIVTPVSDGEAEALRLALEMGAGAGDADGDGFPDAGEGVRCAYPRANGERCKNRAKEGSRYCGMHSEPAADEP